MIRDDLPPIPTMPTPTVPTWAVSSTLALPQASSRPAPADAAAAAFAAGAALATLDHLVHSEPAWAGAWRHRLTLTAAAAATRLSGRREDEAALRDAWLLRAPATEPGPAGQLYAAWRHLVARRMVSRHATRPTARGIASDELVTVVALLGLSWDPAFAGLPDQLSAVAQSGRPAPLAAAAIAETVYALRPDAELLAWWLADLVLALTLNWPQPVPLLMTQRHTAASRVDAIRGARIRPGEDGFAPAVCLAVAQGVTDACRLAATMQRRAERLAAVAPKLRAKGAGEAIALLLNDDAVSGSLTTARLSRFGARRLFQRLEAAGAVRELTGRSAFRLYGL